MVEKFPDVNAYYRYPRPYFLFTYEIKQSRKVKLGLKSKSKMLNKITFTD